MISSSFFHHEPCCVILHPLQPSDLVCWQTCENGVAIIKAGYDHCRNNSCSSAIAYLHQAPTLRTAVATEWVRLGRQSARSALYPHWLTEICELAHVGLAWHGSRLLWCVCLLSGLGWVSSCNPYVAGSMWLTLFSLIIIIIIIMIIIYWPKYDILYTCRA